MQTVKTETEVHARNKILNIPWQPFGWFANYSQNRISYMNCKLFLWKWRFKVGKKDLSRTCQEVFQTVENDEDILYKIALFISILVQKYAIPLVRRAQLSM